MNIESFQIKATAGGQAHAAAVLRSQLARGLLLALAVLLASPASAQPQYAWLAQSADLQRDTIETRFAPPSGFVRAPTERQSFATWLRGLALKPKDTKVLLYNGAPKSRQDVHAAVIDIDTGTKDLQQCADAIMRLRAEWLLGTGQQKQITFTVTSGRRAGWDRYMAGERPDGDGKVWKKTAKPDGSYANFRSYMNFIFAYAGTASLEKELKPVDASDIEIGDVFIKGGFPGHAVIVADMAEHAITKAKLFLLIQSFMPAQEMHVLRNFANGDGSPWYAAADGDLVTPEWTFLKGSLRRWPP